MPAMTTLLSTVPAASMVPPIARMEAALVNWMMAPGCIERVTFVGTTRLLQTSTMPCAGDHVVSFVSVPQTTVTGTPGRALATFDQSESPDALEAFAR